MQWNSTDFKFNNYFFRLINCLTPAVSPMYNDTAESQTQHEEMLKLAQFDPRENNGQCELGWSKQTVKDNQILIMRFIFN